MNRSAKTQTNPVLFPQEIEEDAPIGGKARNLLSLSKAGFAVPPWFVIVDSGGDVMAAYRKLCPNGELAAVRSSAMAEDGDEHSFAGQFDSFLFVPEKNILEKVEAVKKSASSDRVLAYQAERGITSAPEPPSVVVQLMIDAESAGVAFSADPVSGRRSHVVVSSVSGVGEKLVSGEADADTFLIDRAGMIVRRDAAADHDPPSLSDKEAVEIADLARRTESHFGKPQDIEWAWHGGKIYLLQSRSITSLAGLPDPDDELAIWDNSNIAESYSGVTTPMTFTFARRAYESVYREFCGLLRVPKTRIQASDGVFQHMLGLIRGRVYYNLINWYRVLSLLPGFRFNRGFMEQMMGVKEPMPDCVVRQIEEEGADRGKIGDFLALLRTCAGLLWSHLTLNRQIRKFYARLEDALADPEVPLDQMRADELVTHYRDLEDRLLTRWDAPLVNDFLAMIFFGTLTKLCKSWCGDDDGTLQNELISGDGGIISTEPARRIRELAEIAKSEPDILSALAESSASIQDLQKFGAFSEKLNEYLERFGDRCLEELKLESPTLVDAPSSLFGAIVAMARRPALDPAIETSPQQERPKLGLIRSIVFNWVWKNARKRVRDRENLRFERTRLFGRVRRIIIELGRRLSAENVLPGPRDVFYLELDELLGFFNASVPTSHLGDLARSRRAEFEMYRSSPSPPDRFETHGAPGLYEKFEPAKTLAAPLPEGEVIKGIGCCPGVVRGRARLISDPRSAHLEPGDVLVARQTDPGWVMLFPAAAGLLVERGSLLSHSAIVSREMRIPAVVSLRGLCDWIEDGELIELDGKAGTVRKVIDGE